MVCRMVTYPWSTLSDDEGDETGEVEMRDDNDQQDCKPGVEDDEDWEDEIMQLNNLIPYGR